MAGTPEVKPLQKVLIANRGEIAVRVVRACKDAGIGSVAVYADPDRDALFVRLADEALQPRREHARPSPTSTSRRSSRVAESVRRRLRAPGLRVPRREPRVRPGRGRRRPGLDRPAARRDRQPRRQGEGTPHRREGRRTARGRHQDPVADADEVVAFAKEHGLPIAIKAAYGGGGRGLKVARTEGEVADQFESAVREAVSAFGRGECFVEKYLDRPRHVETQCLADRHGNVVVVSTRDCSLQRRHQKLVEEAPAPYLSEEQMTTLYDSSKAILREAEYVGAGTCEFLVGQDGTISFLEVNTRLQVEHPVSEEVTGHRPGPGDVPGGRRRGARVRRPEGRRPLDRVPHQRRGPRRQLHARPGHADPVARARRSGRAARRWLRPRRDGSRLVRLAGREAGGHRPGPHPGAGTVPPGARRVRRRGHAHGDPVPPDRGQRPGLRRRRRDLRRVHQLDRDRVRQPDPAVRRVGGRRPGGRPRRAADRHGRGRRPADRGRAAGRPDGRCERRRRSAEEAQAREEEVRCGGRRRQPSPRRCRARS